MGAASRTTTCRHPPPLTAARVASTWRLPAPTTPSRPSSSSTAAVPVRLHSHTHRVWGLHRFRGPSGGPTGTRGPTGVRGPTRLPTESHLTGFARPEPRLSGFGPPGFGRDATRARPGGPAAAGGLFCDCGGRGGRGRLLAPLCLLLPGTDGGQV